MSLSILKAAETDVSRVWGSASTFHTLVILRTFDLPMPEKYSMSILVKPSQ